MQTFLTASVYRTARLWDVATGQRWANRWTIRAVLPSWPCRSAGREDGLTKTLRTVRLWDVATGQSVTLDHRGAAKVAIFSADGTMLVTKSVEVMAGREERTARVWDVATGRPLGPPIVHQGDLTAVALGPHGTTILTGVGKGRRDSGTWPRAGPWVSPWAIKVPSS
jgi:WD40 repeat protein